MNAMMTHKYRIIVEILKEETHR